MGYKLKPKKGVAKRMKVSATGKIKHRHEKLSHLRSNRTGKTKRALGRPSILAEGHSRNHATIPRNRRQATESGRA